MTCPKCHRKTRVIECWELEDGSVRRKRECGHCMKRFYTVENAEKPVKAYRRRKGGLL